MRDPRERLRDIIEAISAIERYLDRGRAAFEQDELLQGWFVRHLQIIGEAARALPEEVRVMAPNIEWPKIIGMRNVLVHGYFDIDLDIVWNAASRDVPVLRPLIEQLLKQLEKLSHGG
ncbi:MAG: HepT-like ribonuclease domain-containing protein [Candidatus Caldatribacteriaceae bacterium]